MLLKILKTFCILVNSKIIFNWSFKEHKYSCLLALTTAFRDATKAPIPELLIKVISYKLTKIISAPLSAKSIISRLNLLP